MTTLDSVDPLLTFAAAWEPYGGASANDRGLRIPRRGLDHRGRTHLSRHLRRSHCVTSVAPPLNQLR